MNATILIAEALEELAAQPYSRDGGPFESGCFHIVNRLLLKAEQYRAQALRAEEAQPVACPVCAEAQAFTGTCGGGQSNPMALCYIHSAPAEGWTLVADNFPPSGEDVIVCGYFSPKEYYLGIAAHFDGDDGMARGWYDQTHERSYPTPTHWTPLPAAPKE